MSLDEITIDQKIHHDMGMKIISEDRVKRSERREIHAEIWPSNSLFTPSGISFADALAATRLCCQ